MSESEFWSAVRADDVDTVARLVGTSPELVHARLPGEAWEPGHVYDPAVRGQSPAPAGFQFTNTALHAAAVHGRADLASLLLAHGADANAVGYEANKGLTPPVVLAAWEGSLETLRRLLDHGADPNLAASAETALYTAAEHGSSDKVELLLERGARHDVFTAAIVGDATLLSRWIDAYPPLRHARSPKRGRTPEEEAAAHGRDGALAVLRAERSGYAYVWEYTVRADRGEAFEQAYGPCGSWVELFRRAPGYLRTELHRDRRDTERYLTIDYWESAAAWEAFRTQFAAEFEALDGRCADYTREEREIARLDPAP